jgi:hypothetical protein
MKARKLDLISTFILLVLSASVSFAQELTFSPNPELLAVCPNTDITYTIDKYKQACHTITVIGGQVIQDNDDGTLIVNWLDNGVTGTITITREPTGCDN